jgi:hypothetical protein
MTLPHCRNLWRWTRNGTSRSTQKSSHGRPCVLEGLAGHAEHVQCVAQLYTVWSLVVSSYRLYLAVDRPLCLGSLSLAHSALLPEAQSAVAQRSRTLARIKMSALWPGVARPSFLCPPPLLPQGDNSSACRKTLPLSPILACGGEDCQ